MGVPGKLKGLIFLMGTVLGWVGAATLIKLIYTEIEYDKPFFVTYVSDSLNFVYGFVFIKRIFYKFAKKTQSPPENDAQINQQNPNFIKLGLIFAPFLLIANYLYNEGLTLTTIASACIISNTSAIFIFILSMILLKNEFSYVKMLCVIVSFGGICLIALSDNDSTSTHYKHAVIGDIISVISAIIYAFYATLLKRLIPDDSKFSWAGFFTILGLSVVIEFIPFIWFLDLIGLESFQWPPFRTFMFLLLNGLCGTVLPDFLWVRSVVLLDPLIAELGIGLTIPLGMIIDYFVESKRYSFFYILGTLYIMGGFIVITLYDFKTAKLKKEQEENQEEKLMKINDDTNNN